MADDALTDLDPARYLRAPVLDVPGAIALGIALLSSTDGSLSGAPNASAKRLRARVLDLQARGSLSKVEGRSGNPPGFDDRCGRSIEDPSTISSAIQAVALS